MASKEITAAFWRSATSRSTHSDPSRLREVAVLIDSPHGRPEIEVPIPPAILAIVQRLEAAGHEVWCVGGAIRDALLGGEPKDVDLTTSATPPQIRALFPRTIPVGIEHGTIGVLDDDGVLHEVTTFRRDVQTDGRHAVVEFGVSLEDDLARRDFTINAIAYHPGRREWRDPFDGRGDLERGLIRAVGSPVERFREDRLRILRAIRFAARLGFEVESETMAAMSAQGSDTGHLSAERVRDEWVKSLATANSFETLLDLWIRCGVADVWMPELRPDPSVVFATDDDIHEGRSPVTLTAAWVTESAPIWRRFKGSTAEIKLAEGLDRAIPRPADATPESVRRWLAAAGELYEDLCDLDYWRSAGEADREAIDFWCQWSEVLDQTLEAGHATSRSQLAITGKDLLDAGVTVAGPGMGRVLDALLDAVLVNPALNQRETLLQLARSLA